MLMPCLCAVHLVKFTCRLI